MNRAVIFNDYFFQKITKQKVLALGCGRWFSNPERLNGRIKMLEKWSKCWYGADIVLTQKKLPNCLFYTDLNKLDFFKYLPTDVDLIVVIEVLEHLDNPQAFLAYIKENKRRNTKLLVSVPNGSSLGKVLLGFAGGKRLDREDSFHLYNFNNQTLKNLFRRAGYKKVLITPYATTSFRRFAFSLAPHLASGFFIDTI